MLLYHICFITTFSKNGSRGQTFRQKDRQTVMFCACYRVMMSSASGEKRRVAVIGAGLSGLAAIKCSLDEGLLPICYEQHDDIGNVM